MLSNLDQIIFPNSCEVLEIVPQQHYVYPIFKNGSRSLVRSNFRTLAPDELKQLDVVDVFVRDPYERFLSGVNTYLANLDPAVDRASAMFFIKNYLFLNRHFAPQIFWLINLHRFSNTKFRIRPMHELSTVTDLQENSSSIANDIKEYFKLDDKIRFHLEMDEALTVNLIDQTVDLASVVDVLRVNYQPMYREIFQHSIDILDAVSKT